MSNEEIHYIEFGNLILEMRFEGNDYETASVKFKLYTKDGRPTLEESPAIPVKCLFHMAYLIEMSIIKNVTMMKQEVRSMEELYKEKENGKENKTE